MEFQKSVSPLMDVLEGHWLLTLATIALDDHLPYATPLYYSVLPIGGVKGMTTPHLITVSEAQSHHSRYVACGPTAVAAGIGAEVEQFSEISGVQLRGEMVAVDERFGSQQDTIWENFCIRHPIARSFHRKPSGHQPYLFAIQWAKVTDNQWGFGRHLVYEFPRDWSWICSINTT